MYVLPDVHVGNAIGVAGIVMTLLNLINSNEQSPKDVGYTRITFMPRYMLPFSFTSASYLAYDSMLRPTLSPGIVYTLLQPSFQHLQT